MANNLPKLINHGTGNSVHSVMTKSRLNSSISCTSLSCGKFGNSSSSQALLNSLSPNTRFAFTELLISVLKLDFDAREDFDTDYKKFCDATLEKIFCWSCLPERTRISLRLRFEDRLEHHLNDDIVSLITAIKNDKSLSTTSNNQSSDLAVNFVQTSNSFVNSKNGNNETGNDVDPIIHLLGSLLIQMVCDGCYDSRIRVLLRHISALLGCSWDRFEQFESTLVDCILGELDETEKARTISEKNRRVKKFKRYAMIGAAGGIGGVLIGLTGGLAAPLVASGLATLTVSTAFSGLATTAGAAIFGTAFGAAGASLSSYRMLKRVGAIEEFYIEKLTDEKNTALHCVLCVSGFIGSGNEKIRKNETEGYKNKDDLNDCGNIGIDRQDSMSSFFSSNNDVNSAKSSPRLRISPSSPFRTHWRHLWLSPEQYTLRWESKYLEELGNAIEYVLSYLVSFAIQRSLMETVLAGLVSAITWPLALIGSSSVIDNPWNVCTRRAAEVGEQLAEVLLRRKHGQRPITLIGFSLGARVIFHCLLSMSNRSKGSINGANNQKKPSETKNNNGSEDAEGDEQREDNGEQITRATFEANSSDIDYPFGIVEDVILLGAPVTASRNQWAQVCRVVGGRIINGYCVTDWLLRFLYRTMSAQISIAGTSPVDNRRLPKLVNINLSHIVTGHLDYPSKLAAILSAVGVRVEPTTTTKEQQSSSVDLVKEIGIHQGQQQQQQTAEAVERLETSKIMDYHPVPDFLVGFDDDRPMMNYQNNESKSTETDNNKNTRKAMTAQITAEKVAQQMIATNASENNEAGGGEDDRSSIAVEHCPELKVCQPSMSDQKTTTPEEESISDFRPSKLSSTLSFSISSTSSSSNDVAFDSPVSPFSSDLCKKENNSNDNNNVSHAESLLSDPLDVFRSSSAASFFHDPNDCFKYSS